MVCNIVGCKKKRYKCQNICVAHYYKKRRKINPDIYKKAVSRWNNKNPDYFKEYYKNNKDNYKKYQKNNPDVLLRANIKYLKKLGKTFDMTSYKYMYAFNSWSQTIKKLDNNMCKDCDSKDNLNAHHIMPKNDFPELSLDLSNGITLCEKCHGEIHGFGIY